MSDEAAPESELAPIVKASELDPDFAAWVEIEEELLHEGKTSEEIDAFRDYAQQVGFERANEAFRAEGLSEEEIEARWLAWRAELPKDDPNSTDPVIGQPDEGGDRPLKGAY
jgi:hypothetical protein